MYSSFGADLIRLSEELFLQYPLEAFEPRRDKCGNEISQYLTSTKSHMTGTIHKQENATNGYSMRIYGDGAIILMNGQTNLLDSPDFWSEVT